MLLMSLPIQPMSMPRIVKEYVDLAYAFFNKNEPKMVNALLDTIAKAVR